MYNIGIKMGNLRWKVYFTQAIECACVCVCVSELSNSLFWSSCCIQKLGHGLKIYMRVSHMRTLS